MHKIVYKIHEFLEQASQGKIKADRKLVEEFAERVKAAVIKQLEPEDKGFTLRMSNIGRPLRQLMLEQEHGRVPPTPEFMLKMLFGDLYESLIVFLLKSAGVNVTEEGTKVSIPVKTDNGIVNVDGTLDIGIDDGIFDVKSASPFSFSNKFDGTAILTDTDPFGYVDQLFGYAKARNKRAKGWIVVNKVDGEIKVCEIPDEIHDKLMKKSCKRIDDKVRYITEGNPIPECQGVIPETYYGNETGNFVLGPDCKFCPYKTKCHPDINYRPSICSKAKDPKWEWYIGDVKPYVKVKE